MAHPSHDLEGINSIAQQVRGESIAKIFRRPAPEPGGFREIREDVALEVILFVRPLVHYRG